MKKISIFCTLGPSSLNKRFLKYTDKKVSLLRLNMSHIQSNNLEKKIKFIRKFTKTPICIDTEGAQIRTKIKKGKFYKKNSIIKIDKSKGRINFYPNEVFDKLRKDDVLDIGFDDLRVKIISKNTTSLKLKVITSGLFENNKGVCILNRKIKLKFLTEKDIEAIKIGKRLNIKNFALSFTNSENDVKKFKEILPKQNKIFKLETKKAIKNLNGIIKEGKNFLIDRGDLSKEFNVELIPILQRKILKIANLKKNKKVFIATNFLESMITNKTPNRGESNDIYSSLEMGASGLVLAAETAIGKYPYEAINFLNKMIKIFKK